MHLETKHLCLIWLFVSLGNTYGARNARATEERCKKIEPFYGGVIIYLPLDSPRILGSIAYFRCNDGYHLIPKSVDSSCLQKFEWEPPPPQCYKYANAEAPENGHIREHQGTLLHNETYTVYCNNGYELYSEVHGFLEQGSVPIRNNNGTLEPGDIKCKERRCDPADLYKTVVKYKNDSSALSKILSQTEVILECQEGYNYYRRGQPIVAPQLRWCVKGNIENAPVCENAPMCKHIDPFYGGDVQYDGDRKRLTFASYRCNKGYHLSPDNVKRSECTDVLEWDPAPPQCFQVAKVYIPENGHSKDNKDTLLHGESYNLRCKRDYELYKEESGFINGGFLRIRNNNGSLEPQVPKCLEKRCDSADQDKAILKYTNGSRVTSKILSQTEVILKCEPGYSYYEGNTPMETPVKRKCVKGSIKNAPFCEEARCLISGFPNNNETYRRYWSNDLLAEGQYIRPNEKLEVICTKEDGYELFDNTTGTYLLSFTSECRYGRFDKEAKEFPICLEKHCTFKPNQNACYKTNEKEECIRGDFKVPSRKSVTIKCQEGYKLYRSKDGISEYIGDEEQVTCLKGSYFKGYKCIPDSIVQAIKHYVEQAKSTFETTLDRLTCRFSLFESSSCEDPCLVPDIRFGFAKEKFGDRVSNEVTHGTKISVECYHGYDLLKRVATSCKSGEWDIDHFQFCSPKQCSVPQVKNAGLKSKAADKYDHLDKVVLRCDTGHHFNEDNPKRTKRKFKATCRFGKWSRSIPTRCRPDNCVLPYDIDDKLSVNDRSRVISLSSESTVTSGDHVYFNCSKVSEPGYEPLNRRFKCEKGQWIEDEKDPAWVFGNYGRFPKCRKAICEPKCTNGGVCYRDGYCKCKHLTEGKRCEIFRCDEQCTKNGGKCVAAGKCECPKGKYGPTCENKSCRLPENSPKPKDAKIVYNKGDTLKEFECEFGYMLSSDDSMKCQEDGSWSNIVQCIKSVVYLICVQTGDAGWNGGAGTDANVFIFLHGQRGSTKKINMRGDFERNDLDEMRVEERDIRPITSVTIGHDGRGIGPDWLIRFVSVYVESMNEYYVFRLNDPVWIKKGMDGVLPLKDNCVNTFDSGHNWYPNWSVLSQEKYLMYNIGDDDGMTKRACQQKCTELRDFQCQAVHYVRLQKTCWGFSTVNERYYKYKTNQGNWNSVVYIRSCKKVV